MRRALDGAPRKLLALIVFLSTLAAGLVVALVLLLAGVVQTSEHAARRSHVALKEASVARQIETSERRERARERRERYQSTLERCREQNQHHRTGVRALDRVLIRDAPPRPKLQRVKARAAIIVIVEALDPLEDCRAKAAKAIGEKP